MQSNILQIQSMSGKIVKGYVEIGQIYIYGGVMAKIAELIKYEGDNSTFIWKHPSEDFNSLTQLVVHESQEAIFMMNGQALDLFGPGRYTLETQNIPELGKFLKRLTGDTSPFHCEVYFINKTEQMAVKWGTDSKVQFMEPTYHFPIQIGACGEMSLRAEDSRKLLLKLVGTEDSLDQSKLIQYFRAFLMTKVKSYLAQVIREKGINIFEIDEHLNAISKELHILLKPDFVEYGVALEQFFVTTILKPDGESSYERFKSLHFRQYADIAEAKLRQQVGIIEQQTEAQRMVIESQAIAQKRSLEGYTYQQERGFDVAEQVAQNEASGQFSNMGIGLGMMAGVGGTVGNIVGNSINGAFATPQFANGANMTATGQEIMQPQMQQNEQQSVMTQQNMQQPNGQQEAACVCGKCGSPLVPGAKFCMECGEKVIVLPAGMVKCSGCGEVVPQGKFCPECGNKLV